MNNVITRLVLLLVLVGATLGLAGCGNSAGGVGGAQPGQGISEEQFLQDAESRRYAYERRLYSNPNKFIPRGKGRLMLMNLNVACDGMAIEFHIDPSRQRQPIVYYDVLGERGEFLYSDHTNYDGEAVIDFRGHRWVTLVIAEGIMWDMITYHGPRTELMLGTWDHGEVVMRHDYVPLGQLVSTGEQVIEFRGSESYCGSPPSQVPATPDRKNKKRLLLG